MLGEGELPPGSVSGKNSWEGKGTAQGSSALWPLPSASFGSEMLGSSCDVAGFPSTARLRPPPSMRGKDLMVSRGRLPNLTHRFDTFHTSLCSSNTPGSCWTVFSAGGNPGSCPFHPIVGRAVSRIFPQYFDFIKEQTAGATVENATQGSVLRP